MNVKRIGIVALLMTVIVCMPYRADACFTTMWKMLRDIFGDKDKVDFILIDPLPIADRELTDRDISRSIFESKAIRRGFANAVSEFNQHQDDSNFNRTKFTAFFYDDFDDVLDFYKVLLKESNDNPGDVVMKERLSGFMANIKQEEKFHSCEAIVIGFIDVSDRYADRNLGIFYFYRHDKDQLVSHNAPIGKHDRERESDVREALKALLEKASPNT